MVPLAVPVSVGCVDAADVIGVLDALDEAGVRSWVGGGWGVAALAGRQTRWASRSAEFRLRLKKRR